MQHDHPLPAWVADCPACHAELERRIERRLAGLPLRFAERSVAIRAAYAFREWPPAGVAR